MSVFDLSHTSSSTPTRRVDYARDLNQEQLAVVLGGDGPCLVLAGAGSGKTRTLTYRVAYLLEQGIDPSSILLLTFTNKAAREMLSRVEGLLGGAAKGLWGGTFHSIAFRLIRPLATHLGYGQTISILDAEDARGLIKSVMKDRRMDSSVKRFPSPAVVHDVLSFSRNAQVPVAEALERKYPHFGEFVGELEALAIEYQERKRTANVLDFDDLLTGLARLLDDPHLGEAIGSKFRYVLVDEYQDTNALQARIVNGCSAVHGNKLVVGDDAQSIYAFRGADVKNILHFPQQAPNVKMFQLLTNYRSTPQILELANGSLTHNVDQFQKDLIGLCPAGPKPRLAACSSATQEARYVAEQILALRSGGLGLHQIAVLFRSSAQSQALEFELTRRDVPYEYRGGQRFFERAHIKDVLSYLRVFHNPKDEVAWLRVLGLQTGIGATTASALARSMGERGSFVDLLSGNMTDSIPSRAREGMQAFVQAGEAMVRAGTWPAALIRAVATSSYRAYVEREYPNWRERLEDLEQIALFAESYDELSPFLTEIALYEEIAADRETPGGAVEERIVLSTIHQAKGLEWDTVFIIHLCDNAFPNKRAMAEKAGMEEERRLFYVAVTRAKRQLFLTYPLTMGYQSLLFQSPSTFLEEVSPRLFERVEIREPGSVRFKSLPSASSDHRQDDGWDEPSIIVDSADAKQKPTPRTSFLREVDEL